MFWAIIRFLFSIWWVSKYNCCLPVTRKYIHDAWCVARGAKSTYLSRNQPLLLLLVDCFETNPGFYWKFFCSDKTFVPLLNKWFTFKSMFRFEVFINLADTCKIIKCITSTFYNENIMLWKHFHLFNLQMKSLKDFLNLPDYFI